MKNRKFFQLNQIDKDNFRIYYTNNYGEIYCLQKESEQAFEFYECTEEGEPICKIFFRQSAANCVEIPNEDSVLGKEAALWIKKHKVQPWVLVQYEKRDGTLKSFKVSSLELAKNWLQRFKKYGIFCSDNVLRNN